MALTRVELSACADFDEAGFNLRSPPKGIEASGSAGIELGRYELPRRPARRIFIASIIRWRCG